MEFNTDNLYIGYKKVVYKIDDKLGICIRDEFGGYEGQEIYLRELTPCSNGNHETIEDLKERFNKYVKNRNYANLGM